MVAIPFKVVVAVVLVAAVLVLLSALLLSASATPFELKRAYTQGCFQHCDEIQREAAASGERLEIVAVRKAESLANSQFMQACTTFYPETRGNEYLCWNRQCCNFQLPPP